MRRREILLLLTILAIAAALRIERIHFGSLTFDEQWHLELSTGRGSPHVREPWDQVIDDAPAVTSLKDAPPWYAVWTHMDFVVHPPMYCILLRWWRDLFGSSDPAVRALSITFSLVSISLLFFIGREMFGLSTAAWAAAIFAVAPTQVMLAQEVRGYQLLQMFSLAAALSLIRFGNCFSPSPGAPGGGRDEGSSKNESNLTIEEEPSPQPSPTEYRGRGGKMAAVFLGVSLLAMMLTHYFAIGIAAVIGVYALIRFRGRKLWIALATFGLAAVVYLIIWGPMFWRQRTYFAGTADPWLVENDPNHLILTLGRFASWAWLLIVDANGGTYWPLVSVLLLIVPFVLLKKKPRLLLWCLWICGTLGLLLMLDLMRGTAHLKFPRYTSPATPAVIMLAAAIWSKWSKHIFGAVLVIVCLLCWRVAYQLEEPVDWRQLGEVVDQNVQPDEPIIFFSGGQPKWYTEILDLGSAHYSHVFPHTIVRLSKPADENLMRQIPGRTAWLVAGPLSAQDVPKVLPGAVVMGEPKFIENLAICVHVRLKPGL